MINVEGNINSVENQLLYEILLELRKLNSHIERISQEKEVSQVNIPLENKTSQKRKSSK